MFYLVKVSPIASVTSLHVIIAYLAAGRWISLVSSTNKTDRHDITVALLNVALNTINLILTPFHSVDYILLFKNTALPQVIDKLRVHFAISRI
jgi:hypothetical protein